MSNEGIDREFIDSAQLSDKEVERGRHDAEFIRRPHIWPYEFLPLKRTPTDDSDRLYDLALLVYHEGRIVVLENMSTMGPIEGEDKVVTKIHLDAESVLHDGWRVD